MQEHTNETGQKLDLTVLLLNFRRVLRKTWWWVALLAILLGGVNYFRAWRSFRPMYASSAAFSVRSSYISTTDLVDTAQYYDTLATDQVVSSFPYIISSEAMQERIRLALNTTWVNGTVTASGVGDTNIFTLTVTSSSPQDAYDILNAVIENYPQVASFVIGSTQLLMIDEPALPTAPVNSFQGTRTAIKGGLIGLIIGLLVTVLLAAGRRTVRAANDLKQSTSMPCLGTIPQIRVKRRSKAAGNAVSVLNQHLGDALSAPISAIQVRLLRKQKQGDGAQTVLVTSTIPGEGKTTVSFNLAASLAKSGKQVILVDADLRHQVVKSRFGIKAQSAGLLELSRASKPDVSRVLLSLPGVENLRLLAGDSSMDSPMSILDSQKMRGILRQTRALADYVIIDAPPAGILADAAVLCRSADQVLYVVRYDCAPQSQIGDAMHSLSGRGAELTGYVLNGQPVSRSSGYGRYGYGKYGYGYGQKYGYGGSRTSGKQNSDSQV